MKIPDAFQQKLSSEKTPTLCNTLPSFDAMVTIWKDLQDVWGEPFSDIIQEGIDKLDAYHERVELVPAYVISMSMSFSPHTYITSHFMAFIVLNPLMKLKHIPAERHDEAKELLRTTVCQFMLCHSNLCNKIFLCVALAVS